jgi:hypothetical protein
MLTKMATANPEVIIIPGDLVTHGVTSKDYKGEPSHEVPLKQILAKVHETITTKFPLIPVLPSIGNNDVVWHYQPPVRSEEN